MSTREDFEAWAGPKGYPLRTIGTGERISYSYGPTLSAFAGYQAATSRQEAKIKALVEALEQIKHSITQMQMPENDKRREVLLIQNTVAEALALAKETP